MWTPDDPSDLARMQEERWNEMREASDLQRLARAGRRQQGPFPEGLMRALLLIEHTFSFLMRRLSERRPNTVRPDPVSDAELVRMLALLAHDGTAVRVQPLQLHEEEVEEEARCG